MTPYTYTGAPFVNPQDSRTGCSQPLRSQLPTLSRDTNRLPRPMELPSPISLQASSSLLTKVFEIEVTLTLITYFQDSNSLWKLHGP